MEYRTLEINVISAKDLNDVNLFTKMDVYVAVSIAGDPQGKQKTKVDRDGGKNPTWNFPVKFTIEDTAARQNNVTVLFQLRCDRALGDKDIGEVCVPVKELLETVDKPLQHVSYQVRTPSGKAKGALNISYKFGEKFTPATAPAKPSGYEAAVTAYPASAVGPSSGYPPNPVMSYAPPEKAQYPPPNGYPPPQPVAEYGYPQQQPPPQTVAGYGYPQQQQPPPYGEYPPPPPHPGNGYPPQPGYGYPPQPGYGYPPQPGYGYPPQQGQGYPPQQGYGYPPVQQPAAKKKNKFGGMGMGLGAGLLGGAIGGMLIGDMVSDGGFDDAGEF